MKNTLAGVLAVLCAASSLPAAASAEGIFNVPALAAAADTESDFTVSTLSDGTLRISKYTGSDTEVVIPAEIDGVSVTAIARRAFSNCTDITSVTIPDSITTIGDLAFEGCKSLTSIAIPASVTSIYTKTFSKCESLASITVDADNEKYSSDDGVLYDKKATMLILCPMAKESINIPETVTTISANALENCSLIKEIVLPDTLSALGDSCFANCTSLEKINIPENVRVINYYAFQGCSSLVSAAIPDGAYIIATGAFDGCTSLSDIVIPESVINIDDSAFNNCSSLESVVLPDQVAVLGSRAFYGCSKLAEINIPSALTYISQYTFQNCESLTAIDIPEGIKEINSEAFRGCSKLRSIGIPSSVKYISNGVFWDCNDIQSVFYGGTKTQWDAISITSGNDSLTASSVYYSSSFVRNPALTYEEGEAAVKLEWEASEEVEKYAVCVMMDDKWQIVAKTSDTTKVVNGLKGDTEYKIAVLAMIDGNWNMDFSNYITATPKEAPKPNYPTVSAIDYNEEFHQFKLKWSKVPDAQNYGVAVYLTGKWKVQTQTIPGTTTTFTSPKLTPGKSYKMVIAAKVNGTWDLSNLNSRAFTVTIK